MNKVNKKILILNDFLNTENGFYLKSIWLRVSNILDLEEKKNKKIAIFNSSIQNDFLKQEVNLVNEINNIEKTEDYLKMLNQRSFLKDVTYDFFENLKINDSNELIKKRRLSILALLRERLLELGNLYNLEGNKAN